MTLRKEFLTFDWLGVGVVLVSEDEPAAVFCKGWRGFLTGIAAGLVTGAAGAVGVISLLALIVGSLVVLVGGVFVLGVELELDAALSRVLCLACSCCCFFLRSWTWRCRCEPSIAYSVAIATPCLPLSEGFNLQFRACLKVSSSNLLLPLELTIRAPVTLPLESVSTATSTFPSIPCLLANSG